MGKTILALFILTIVGTGGYFAYDTLGYQRALQTPASQDTKLSKKIAIPTRSTLAQVASLLRGEGIVSDASNVSSYVRSQG